jgi:hypothetical protein
VDGIYRLEGTRSVGDDAASGLPFDVVLSRNARLDSFSTENFLTSTTPVPVTGEVDALADDRLVLTIVPLASTDEPVAFDFTVDLVGTPTGTCQFAATFTDPAVYMDRCGGVTLDPLFLPPAAQGPQPGPSLNVRYGGAGVFTEGQYLDSLGAAMDYTRDFTIQFWGRFDDPQPSFDTIAYSDINTGFPGGVQIVVDFDSSQDQFDIRAAFTYDNGTNPGPIVVLTGRIPDAGWHFYRFSRDYDAGIISWCVDGVRQAMDATAGQLNMTSDQTPNLGKSSFAGVAYFAGSLDDVRIFRRALPCN